MTSSDGPAEGPGVRPSWRRELSIWLGVLAIYVTLTSLDWAGRHAAAVANSRWIFDLERALHIDVESKTNHWLAQQGALRVAANYEYALTYIVTSFALLIWLYVRRPRTYPRARTSFILINLVALACFLVYPVAPPRLVTDLGFVDTVVVDRTWGSWGSPLVSHANQLAAMPSLHIAWALWVSLILGTIAGSWRSQSLSGLHVLVTLLVIMATANHYLLDAAGGAVLAVAGVALTIPRTNGIRSRAAKADALYAQLESQAAPDQIGAVALLGPGEAGRPSRDGELRDVVVAVVRAHLNELPRLGQRLSISSRWRRPRWVEHPELDWSWHVPERALAGPDGHASLCALAAEVDATQLHRDRPLWRFIVVPSTASGQPAVILVAHRVVANEMTVIAQALSSLQPAVTELPGGLPLHRRPARASRRTSPTRSAAGNLAGGRQRARFPITGPQRRLDTGHRTRPRR